MLTIEWDHDRKGRSGYDNAGAAGTGNKCPPGMQKVVSPISGATLITTEANGLLKDPLTGTKLRLVGGRAERAYRDGQKEYNSLNYSKKFHIDTEIDILVQSIRRTNYINKNTNEQVCSAGSRDPPRV